MSNLVRDKKPIEVRITGSKDLVLRIERFLFNELNFFNDSYMYIDRLNNYTKFIKLKNTENIGKNEETRTLKSPYEVRIAVVCTRREAKKIVTILNKYLILHERRFYLFKDNVYTHYFEYEEKQ